MTKQLYIFHGNSGSRSAMITAAALGIPLELHALDFVKGEHKSAEYVKLNPQSTAPTLVDNGAVICDSHAIIPYLVRKYAKDDSLYPRDFYKRALVDQRLHFDSGVLFPILLDVDMAFFKKEITEVPPGIIERMNEAYGFLEIFLKGQQWIAGDCVTLADICLAPTVSNFNYHVKLEVTAYPKVVGWLKRCQELPYFANDKEEQKEFENFFKNL